MNDRYPSAKIQATLPRQVLRRSAWQAASRLLPIAGRQRLVEKLENRTLLSVSTNSQGFTVVTPSADTRIVYVAASGSDSNNGLSPAAPVATIAQARTLVRSGFPDWIVLRRGDTFNGQRFSGWTTSGRSADEPFVIGAYTDPSAPSTARPKLNTGVNTGISFSGTGASHVYIMGLEFEAHRRDYREPPSNFTVDWLTDQQGGTYGINGSVPVNNILVEDSFFRYYKTGLVFQNNASNIRVRRNVIADSWAVNVDGFGNPMGFDTAANGIYTDRVTNLAIDANVFSHNGWVDSNALGARQNLYSHNLYLNTGNVNVSVTNNIIADAASHGLQMRAGGLVKGNLFLRNPIAMSYGLVNGAVKAGGVSGEISDNVVVGSAAIFDSARGWGIEIANLKSASEGGGTVIRNNVFANDTQNTNPAIKLDQPNTTVPDVGINDLLIEQNVVYAWWKGINIHQTYGATRPITGLVVRQNDFQRIKTNATFAEINGPFNAANQSWYNNRYDSINTDPNANLFKIAGVNKTLAQWQAQVEPTAVRALGIFPDPGRTAGGYNATIGGVNSTSAFIAQAMRQSRSFWRTKYTADPANDWIRAGYAGGRIDTAAPTASADTSNITIAGDTTHTFTITWADDNQLNLASLSDGDVRVLGPNGYSAAAALVSSTGPAEGRLRTATYRIAAPAGGAWTASANGLYAVVVEAGQVLDASGKSAAADPIGSFSVTIDPAVPSAVATATTIITDHAPATVNVTYTGANSPELGTSVSPLNAGFETPNVASVPEGYLHQPTGGGWTFLAGSGISGNNTAYTSGNPAAPQGGQVAFLQGTGVFSQSVTEWQAGKYTISFQAAQRGNWSVPMHDFQVLVDGNVVGTFSPSGTTYQRYATAEFTVAAGNHTVEFRGLATTNIDTTSFIDDIQIGGKTTATVQRFSLATFDPADIQLTGPNGFTAMPTSAAVDDPTEGSTRVVTYTVPAPAGGWSSIGAPALAVRVVAGQVVTTSGTAVPAGKVGTLGLMVNAPVVAAVNAADVAASSSANQSFTITYTDNAPGTTLAGSVGSNDLRVTGPGGYNQGATLIDKVGDGTAASPLIATYTVTAPVGGWSSAVNGVYWIEAQANQVIDADGNGLPAGAIGSFAVAIDTTAPIAAAVENNVVTPATTAKVIGVSYYDISGVLGTTLDNGDIRILGPNGFDVPLTYLWRSDGTTASYAEYSLAPRDGKWQSVHNGVYSVVLQPNQVFDNLGNTATTAATLTTFSVALETTPPTAVLAEPIPNPRNTAVGSITITFDEAVAGVDLADLSLTRNGVAVSLTGAALTNTSNSVYTLSNLTSVTGTAGTYTLTLGAAGSGIVDASGNAFATSAATTWTMDVTAPTATATAGNVTTRDTSPTISVTYSDNIAMNVATLDNQDIRVTGPGGFDAAASFVSVSGTNGIRTATYTLSAPANGWKSSQNGTYSIVLQASQVFDTAGNAVPAGAIGSFSVALETTAPTVAIAAVTPNPRSDPVTSIAINFSEVVSGFDLADLSLTRDGAVISLSDATLSTINGTNYTLSNLSSVTGAAGSYSLMLSAVGSGITDAAGNALATGASTSWTTQMIAVRIVSWASAAVHGRGVGEAALTIADDGSFSEPRLSGISTLLITFDGPINPASLTAAGVGLWGNNINSQPINLSGTTITTATRNGNTVAVLSFSPRLPDIARYLVRLTGVTSSSGGALTGDNDRIMTALLGDASGDRRVNNTDVGGVMSYRGIDPINPLTVLEVRSDASLDGRINNTDVGGIMGLRGNDARFIANPTPSTTSTATLMHLMEITSEYAAPLPPAPIAEASAANQPASPQIVAASAPVKEPSTPEEPLAPIKTLIADPMKRQELPEKAAPAANAVAR